MFIYVFGEKFKYPCELTHMHKHPHPQAQTQVKVKQDANQTPFIGYSINYYTVLIRHAVSFVNDIKLLHEIANKILNVLDDETRERVLNELSFLTRRNIVKYNI